MVRFIFTESGDSTGTITIAQIATTRDFPLSRYRTNSIMKGLGLVSCQIPKHAYKQGGNEHAAIPNQVWCGDVTYIWAVSRWCYLAVVINLFVRKPIGWSMSYSPDTALTGKALSIAFERTPQSHPAQDCHYTSEKYCLTLAMSN